MNIEQTDIFSELVADINADGNIDVLDIVAFKKYLIRTVVYLSDKGHALRRDNDERFVTVDNEMMAGFSPEEIELLRSMLLRIRDNLEKPKGREE